MFDNLTDRFNGVLHKIRGYGKITSDNISDIVREIRLVLLEADVNYKVVKDFTARVTSKALGEEVNKSLRPDEVFVKIIKDELVNLLGNEKRSICIKSRPSVMMMVGLQGSGKTTTVGKLANLLRKGKIKKPLLVACDVYRPAAILQLQQIGKSLNIDVYEEGNSKPLDIANNAVKYAKDNDYDLVIIDTAGRLHIDEELIEEVKSIRGSVNPDEVFLVIDAMMGQDAINVIKGFNEAILLTSVILTKMDGDTKGGVALSVRELTNVPIMYVGVSEKLDGLEEFDSVRMANRILGMGDLLSIVEKVESVMDNEEETVNSAKRFQSGKFDLNDFLVQMKSIKKMGPLGNLLKLLPGASRMGLSNVNIDPKQIAHVEAIILSMTPYERRNPDVIKASRKERIAKGSGRSVQEVNRLLTQFEEFKKLMKQFNSGNMKMPF